jgi:replicative DNA helicase
MDTVFNLEELLENTEHFIRERAIACAMSDALAKKEVDGTIDAGFTFDVIEKACNISLVDDLGHDYFYQIDKHIEDLKCTHKYISTGYQWLDKMMGGGLLESGRAMYVFTGGTNSGKSIILGNLAVNIAKQGRNVAVITLEMPETIYSTRIDSQLTRLSIRNMCNQTSELKEKVQNFLKEKPSARLFIKEYPPNSITSGHIKAYIKKLQIKERLKIDVVVLDYINLVRPFVHNSSMYQNIKATTEELRALTYPINLGCPIVSATQLNRSGTDVADPGLDTLSESMGLGHTVDFLASIYSDENERSLGRINFGMQKNRFGLNYGTQAFKIDYDTLAIDETSDMFSSQTEHNQRVINSFGLLEGS